MAVLIARLEQMHQYDAARSIINWEDPTPERWTELYNRLTLGDSAIFLSNKMLFIGEFHTSIPNTSITFTNVRNVNISNNAVLSINALSPEKSSRIKANFRPFIPDYPVDTSAVYDSAQNHDLISFYVCRVGHENEIAPPLRNGDRVVYIDDNNRFTQLSICQDGNLITANFGTGFFNVYQRTLNEILNIHQNTPRPEGRRISIGARSIEKIIRQLRRSPYYRFKGFVEYYNVIHNKRVYLNTVSSDEEDTDQPGGSTEDKSPIMSKNIILYGPPGTGKTYISKRLALQIIEDASEDVISTEYPNDGDIAEAFEKYQESGQAGFVTFHQSFGYEDFIEGIKPKLLDGIEAEGIESKSTNADVSLGYKLEDGIFKVMSERARSYQSFSTIASGISFDNIQLGDLQKKNYFKMSLGNTQLEEDQEIYQYCVDNNCIGLGWGGSIDFTKEDTDQKIIARFEKEGGARSRYAITAMKCFRLWMQKGDIVFIADGNLKVRALGLIDGPYYFDSRSPIGPNHFRKVIWLQKDVQIPVNEIYKKKFSQQTIYQLWNKEVNLDFFNQARQVENKLINHVLIIDEINRGNIASIFGELITLIEEDKREGESEAITVKLTYSKKPFSVPKNLYIIGTMNTADRSVEALDTALRRRFSFRHMTPEPAKLIHKPDGIDLMEMLKAINYRLEILLDADHTIGHAWFWNIKTLPGVRSVFKDKIIPLFQEFFYKDYEKIRLVLGDEFIEKKKIKSGGFAKRADHDSDELAQEYEGKTLYHIKPIEDLPASAFISIYQ